jgi:hypothetical protein
MSLNILRNSRTVYYNCLTNFYLILNTVLPYYDDVIITMQKYALMHLNVDETQLKKNKLLQFITEVCENNNKYKVMVNNDLKTVHFVEIEEDDNDELDYQEDVTNQEEKVLDNDPETSDEEGKKNL